MTRVLIEIIGGDSGAVASAVTPPPAAPTALTMTAASTQTSQVLTWTNPIPAGTTNEIWQSINGGAFALLASISGALSTYTAVYSIVANQYVSYKVKACNGISCSAFTSQVDASYNLVPSIAAVSYPTLIRAFGFIDMTGSGIATSFSAPLLKSITGAIDGTACAITTVNLTSLQTATGAISFAGTLLGSVSLPALISCGGLEFSTNPNLATFTASSLVTNNGTVDFADCTSLTSCNLASLAGGVTTFNANNCPLCTTLTVTSLTGTSGDFNVGASGMVTLSLPVYTHCGGNFYAGGNGSLVTLSIGVLATVTGDFSINGSSSVLTLTATLLSSVGSNVDVGNCVAMTSFSFPALVTVTGGLDFHNCFSLTTATLTVLQSVGTFLGYGSTSLTALSLPAFVTMGSDFVMSGCTLLANVSFPQMIFVDGGFAVDFTNCALVQGVSASGTGVDGILRRCVASGLTQETIDLSGGTSVAPGANGLIDQGILVAAGCSVNTN